MCAQGMKGSLMIEVRGLTKRYDDKLAVDNLTFAVEPGKVMVHGKRYRGLNYSMREMGALLEAKAVHGGRSAYNHLLCLAQTNDIPKRRVDEVLGLVGLTEVAKKRSKGFSLGMSQRLGIAGALL